MLSQHSLHDIALLSATCCIHFHIPKPLEVPWRIPKRMSRTPPMAHPKLQGLLPSSAAGMGWGVVTSKAVSPPELGDNMYREGFWGHGPHAFIFKIYINRHTYSFLKGHGNKGNKKKKQLKYHPTFQPEKTTQFSQA